jgi:hypothetical protein
MMVSARWNRRTSAALSRSSSAMRRANGVLGATERPRFAAHGARPATPRHPTHAALQILVRGGFAFDTMPRVVVRVWAISDSRSPQGAPPGHRDARARLRFVNRVCSDKDPCEEVVGACRCRKSSKNTIGSTGQSVNEQTAPVPSPHDPY